MLIKRILAIRQVGGFYDFRGGGALPFADQGHQFTLVFGWNTYGKSTLAEVMSSLGGDNPTMLDARESIPSSAGISRLVDLNYLAKDGTEKNVKLTSSWSANELTGNIDVFDEDFVHRNLITGNKIVRENHEDFTDFILGEEGVDLSNRIEELKRTIRKKRGALGGQRPPFVSGSTEAEVEQFVKLAVTDTDEQLAKKRDDHERSLRRMTEADKFLALPDLPGDVVDESATVVGVIDSSSSTLASGYTDVTESVQTVIHDHIDHYCAGDTGAMRWLKTGQAYAKNDTCPFCGGALSAGNVDLLTAYGQLFNEAFEAHDVRIQSEIQEIKAEVARLSAVNAANAVPRVIDAATKFDKFVPGLQEDIATLNEMLAPLVEAQEAVTGRLAEWDGNLTPLLALKQQAPQREIAKELDEDRLRAPLAVLSTAVKAANDVMSKASGTFLAMTFRWFSGRRKVSSKQSRDQRVCHLEMLAL